MNVRPGGEIHDGVCAPADAPGHLVDFFFDGRGHRGVTQVAVDLHRKLRPMIIGSDSGWLILQGMIARPAATSARTNSGVISSGSRAPKPWPACWWPRMRSTSSEPSACRR